MVTSLWHRFKRLCNSFHQYAVTQRCFHWLKTSDPRPKDRQATLISPSAPKVACILLTLPYLISECCWWAESYTVETPNNRDAGVKLMGMSVWVESQAIGTHGAKCVYITLFNAIFYREGSSD